ncbi:hypothetical protein OS493_000415 [Desmophyllum pertusum]|uniref:Uncharacterized protein n=1 Tax=Desmophyllum pertusum TaxID=174260 RepID=A0A9X0A766_9CNID|nr:hypothetical protein OS493_000415 [Desmophyllum pertusum]
MDSEGPEENLAVFFTEKIDETIQNETFKDQSDTILQEEAEKSFQKVEVNITPKVLNSLKRSLCTVAAKEEESGEKKDASPRGNYQRKRAGSKNDAVVKEISANNKED